MEQDKQQTDEEIKRQNEAQDSELSDSDLENVAGGKHNGTPQPMPPTYGG